MKLKLLVLLQLFTTILFAQNNKSKDDEKWETATFDNAPNIDYKLFDNGADIEKKALLNLGIGVNNVGLRWFFSGNLNAVYFLNDRFTFVGDYSRSFYATKGGTPEEYYLDSYTRTISKPYQQIIDVTGTFNFFSKTNKKKINVVLDSKSSSGGNRTYVTNYVVEKEIEHNQKIGLNVGFRLHQSNTAVLSTYIPRLFSDSVYFISDNSRYILKTGIRFQGNHNYEVDFKTKKSKLENKIYFVDINLLTMFNSVNSYSLYDRSLENFSSATFSTPISGDKQTKFGGEIMTSVYRQYNEKLWTNTVWSFGFIPGRFENERVLTSLMFKLNYTVGFAL